MGAELTSTRPSAVRVFDGAGLATVDSIDTVPGKVALAVLLAGPGRPRGNYGIKETAGDGVSPAVEPVGPPAPGG